MILTRDEEKILNGDEGEAKQLAMRLLVGLGEVEGAKKLIPIKSAHIAGVSYNNIGEEGLEFLKEMVRLGAKVRVHTTINPCGIDIRRWNKMGVEKRYVEKQSEVLNAYKSLGARPTCTCTPYLFENVPGPGDHVAWAESSAVIYINSFIGAYTNKESGISALAAAMIGKTPYYGLHIDEEREPQIVFRVKKEVNGAFEFGLLGYIVGLLTGEKIPIITGVEPRRVAERKQFAGGFSASSSVGMARFSLKDVKTLEQVDITDREFQRVVEEFSSDDIDMVYLGCPHLDISEVREIAMLLKGKKVKRGKRLWLGMSRSVYRIASDEGLIDIIKKSGGEVYVDSCLVVAPIQPRSVGTDAVKTAHYLKSMKKIDVTIMSIFGLLREVT